MSTRNLSLFLQRGSSIFIKNTTKFRLKTILPGNSLLHVEVWDHDEYVKDDLIGETVIDLENRFFSKKWRNLKHIPLETRELFHPTSSVSRGRVRMWIELIDVKDVKAIGQKWDIKPQPPKVALIFLRGQRN